MIKICENFCFAPKRHISISMHNKALNEYSSNLESALNLDGKTPIFLDTNVLLDYYKISFSERNELEKFLESNKERIYLTNQIESEFLKHRIDHIRSYLKSLDEFVNAYKNIKSEIERLKSGEIKGFKHYIDNNIILRNDFQELRLELITLNETITKKLKSVFSEQGFVSEIIAKEKKIEEIRSRLEVDANIERQDPLLEIISGFKITDKIDNEEIEFIKTHFKELNNQYEEVKGNNNSNWKYTFPGCGEKKEDPYGDLIIYHEILKFMKQKKKNAIFLTNDVEKNDWLLRNKADLIPYTHYIVNSFANTEQTLFIFQAKDKIRVSYSPVYQDEEQIEKDEVEPPEIQPKLQGIKITGKYNLADLLRENFDEVYNHNYKIFDEISEEEFINELGESEKWASRYGEGFVGLKSFIFKYLGSKGYDYKASYKVKDKLLEKDTVETYTYKPDNPNYNPVEAIRIKK